MIDRTHQLSITRQAKALRISRGCPYYKPRPVSCADLALMRWIDELHLEYPFAGSRMLQGLLLGEDYKVGRLHVRTLMKRMGIEAIYRRPNTSKPAPGHKIYPLSSAQAYRYPAQSGLGDGYYLHSHEGWLCVSGCRYRLVHTPGFILAAFHHPGDGLLH